MAKVSSIMLKYYNTSISSKEGLSSGFSLNISLIILNHVYEYPSEGN